MPIYLQISRHRRNHSQHVLKEVIPPLEQLVSDEFTTLMSALMYCYKINYHQLSNLKQHVLFFHVLWVRNLGMPYQYPLAQRYSQVAIKMAVRTEITSELLTGRYLLSSLLTWCWQVRPTVQRLLCHSSQYIQAAMAKYHRPVVYKQQKYILQNLKALDEGTVMVRF